MVDLYHQCAASSAMMSKVRNMMLNVYHCKCLWMTGLDILDIIALESIIFCSKQEAEKDGGGAGVGIGC